MDTFVKDCKIIQLYCENADNSAVNEFFMEASDPDSFGEKAQKIKDKICDTIDKIIETIKTMYRELKKKLENAKLKHSLKSEAARSIRKIRADVNDKQIIKATNSIYKIQNKAIMDIKKEYDKFMSHKIDFDTYCDNIQVIETKCGDAIEKIQRDLDDYKLINTQSARGQFEVRQLAKYVNQMAAFQDKIVGRMEKDVIEEETRLRAIARQAAAEQAAAAASTKRASLISKINRKAVVAITAIIGIGAAMGTVFALGKRKGSKGAVTESAEDDYFDTNDYMESLSDDYDDFLGDSTDFEESAYDYESMWDGIGA